MSDHSATKKRGFGLGKGLTELGIGELLSQAHQPLATSTQKEMQLLPIDVLQSGRYQPRRHFNSEQLQELANSIRAQGIIQPLIVRAIANHRYEIIAGERRWRAAQLAQLNEVPVVIREISDETALAVALIENIQRQDLNPLEEAQALQRLIEEFAMTHEEAAQAVGKARATVSNLLRLLQLNPDVKILLEQQKIELGHAKLLLSLNGIAQSEMAQKIVQQQLSVRHTETLLQQSTQAYKLPPAKNSPTTKDPNIVRLEQQLADQLGAVVSIQHQTSGAGQLIVRYNSIDELEGILSCFKPAQA